MEGLLKFNDLEEHFSNSLIIIDQRNEIDKAKENLEAIVDKLTEEIRVLKQSEHKLTHQLKTFSCSTENQDGINSLYTKLKGKYNELQENCNQLEKDKVKVAENCKLEKNEMTEEYLDQIKDLEEKMDDQKNEFLKTQSVLQNKLLAQQASADIRFDEMESNLKSQIRDISKQLHDSIQSCNTIRQELFSMKTYNNTDIDAAKRRILELERELRLSRQQLQLNEQNQFNPRNVHPNNIELPTREINQPPVCRPTPSEADRPATNIVKNRIVVYNKIPQNSTVSKPSYVYGTSKYPTLNNGTTIDQSTSSSEEFVEGFYGNGNPPLRNVLKPNNNAEEFTNVLRGNADPSMGPSRNIKNSTASSIKYKQNNKNYSIPPLKPLAAAQPKSILNVKKKRKIYDPYNLDYLDDMDVQE